MSSSFSSSFSSSTRRYRPGVSSGFSSSRRNEPSYTDRHSPRYISSQIRERMDQQWQSDVKLLNRIDRFAWKTSNLYDNSVYMKREWSRQSTQMSDLHDRARSAFNRIDEILSRPDMKKLSMISKENNFNTHSKYHFKL